MYVQRIAGNIVGVFARLQPGIAEEFLATDDPEILAFLAEQEAPEEAVKEELGSTKQWYIDNPDASALFDLSIIDLMAQIDSLDLSSLPSETANKLTLLLKTLSIGVRVLAKREGLI